MAKKKSTANKRPRHNWSKDLMEIVALSSENTHCDTCQDRCMSYVAGNGCVAYLPRPTEHYLKLAKSKK